MKMHFTLVIAGEDSLEKKFEQTLAENPQLHIELIRSFGQTIMLALRLKEEDKIVIESFRAGKIPDQEEIPKKEEEKVDN